MTFSSDPNVKNNPGDAKGQKHVLDFDRARITKFVDQLYRDHWQDLTGWLMARFGSGPPEPEEIAQTAFTKIAALKNISHIQTPRNFLFTTAVNCGLDMYRRGTTMKAFLAEATRLQGQEVGEITPERVYGVKEQIEALSEDLKVLTSKQRETVIRSRLLGQTFEEITAETGWSKSAIGRYLQSGLKELIQKRFERDQVENGTDE